MSHYQAYIQAEWEKHGIASLVVIRHRADGSADFGVFMLDLYCLGVKDAMAEFGLSKNDMRTMLEERLPPAYTLPFAPECARKLIDGAVAYAESLGFAPHRDFRKARKIISGIDASACERTFTYGREGRPCYMQGPDDSEERVDRVLGMLEARFGADGFDFVAVDNVDDDEDFSAREKLMDFLADEPEEVPRFFHVNGLMSAMVIGPEPVSPLELEKAIWGPEGRGWKTLAEAKHVHGTLFAYWNELIEKTEGVLVPEAPPELSVIDFYGDELPEGDGGGLAFAALSMEWCSGFLKATELWPDVWAEALARPDLAPHWEVLGWWAEITDDENRENMIAAAESTPPRTLNTAFKTIARALRPQAK